MVRETLSQVAGALAVVGALTLLADAHAAVSLTTWGLALALVVALHARTLMSPGGRSLLGSHVTVRLVLAIGLAGPLLHGAVASGSQDAVLAWLALGLHLVLLRSENTLRQAGAYTGLRVANLPGIHVRSTPAFPPVVVFCAQLVTSVVLLALGLTSAPGWAWLVVVLVDAALAAALCVDALGRRLTSRAATAALRPALEALAPRFVLYWDVPTGPAYQLSMWLPYLERIGEPWMIVLRTNASFPLAAKMTDRTPIVLARSLTDLENVVVPSLTTAFYVNNAARNTHLVRYSDLTHVQLLHGDSDKAPSYNPVTAMFDKIFVAGQAGIDRYPAHGVLIPDSKFVIVGRPQVEDVQQSDVPVASIAQPRVLYAPTWQGYREDSNYSSLPVAVALMERLLARGATVTFRPHPYSYQDGPSRAVIEQLQAMLAQDAAATGRPHVWGAAAETETTIVECFNAADAMVADVSSVVPDFLYSKKPWAIMSRVADRAEFLADFPLAAAGYVVAPDLAGVDDVLDAMLGDDPLRAERERLRTHYLGDFPASTYAQAFVDAARDVVRGA